MLLLFTIVLVVVSCQNKTSKMKDNNTNSICSDNCQAKSVAPNFHAS